MAKLILLAVLVVAALVMWRNWQVSRRAPQRRAEGNLGNPRVGVAVVVVAAFVLLMAVFVLPRLIERLP